MTTALTEIIPAAWRKPIYAAFALAGLALGVIASWYGPEHVPDWHAAATNVYLYVGGALGITAAANTLSARTVLSEQEITLAEAQDELDRALAAGQVQPPVDIADEPPMDADGNVIRPLGELEDEVEVVDEADDDGLAEDEIFAADLELEDEVEVVEDLDESSLEQAAREEIDRTPPPATWGGPRH